VHFKRKLAIATTVLAGAAFAGGAYAAAQDSPGNQRQAFLNDAAKRLNVTPQQLSAALTGAFQDQLNAAVKAGKLTQAQANALAQRFKQGGRGPIPGLGLFGDPGPFGRPGPAGVLPPLGGPFRRGRPGGIATAAAKYLGLTDAQLITQLRSGKTLAQVATARGKSVSGLEQAMTAAFKARLDRAVANKRITSAQEQKLLTAVTARIKQEVNEKLGQGFRGVRPRAWGVPGGPPNGPYGGPPKGPYGGPPNGPYGGPPNGAPGRLPGALFEPAPPPAPPGGSAA
jgi:hypothetical protein